MRRNVLFVQSNHARHSDRYHSDIYNNVEVSYRFVARVCAVLDSVCDDHFVSGCRSRLRFLWQRRLRVRSWQRIYHGAGVFVDHGIGPCRQQLDGWLSECMHRDRNHFRRDALWNRARGLRRFQLAKPKLVAASRHHGSHTRFSWSHLRGDDTDVGGAKLARLASCS